MNYCNRCARATPIIEISPSPQKPPLWKRLRECGVQSLGFPKPRFRNTRSWWTLRPRKKQNMPPLPPKIPSSSQPGSRPPEEPTPPPRCLGLPFPLLSRNKIIITIRNVHRAILQKTREGCGCFWGFLREFWRKVPGKFRENC